MGYQSEEDLIQNLKDAGCRKALIEEFLKCAREGEKDRCLKVLEVHRRSLLDEVHRGEKKIDCLDYLVYQMKRGNGHAV